MPSETMPETYTTPTALLLGELTESPTNPRKGKDDALLDELAASIRAHGILQPLVVRVRDDGRYEIVAGHRRFVAAYRAGLKSVPVTVRDLTIEQAREVQLVENLQRADMHPLHEAQGYRELVMQSKLDVARIAERIGRTPQYVYDRLRLLDLSAASRKLFLAGKFTLGHAILLARLSEADQARALNPDDMNALWQHEGRLLTAAEEDAEDSAEESDPLFLRKAKSAAELKAWIDRHVRLDPRAEDAPTLFPLAAAAAVKAEGAVAKNEQKLIPLTTEYHVHPDAKGDGSRTFGPTSWRRAGELEGEPTCEHAVLGVIVLGAGRGDAFPVCTAKKVCKVHWADAIKAAKQTEKARVSGGQDSEKFKEQEREIHERRAREEAEYARWQKAKPALIDALAAAITKMSAVGVLATLVDKAVHVPYWANPPILAKVPRGKSVEDLVRHMAFRVALDDLCGYGASDTGRALAKKLGFDAKAVVDKAVPVQAEKPAPGKKAAKAKKAK